MSIYTVIMSFVMLSITFKQLVSIKKSKDLKETENLLNNLSDDEMKVITQAYYVGSFIIQPFVISFWFLSAFEMLTPILYLFAAFNITFLIHTIIRTARNFKRKVLKRYLFDKIVDILNLIYILYFIIFFVFKPN